MTDPHARHNRTPSAPASTDSSKGKEKTQSGGFKFFNKVSHVAWDKFKGPRLNAKSPVGRSISPQQSIATKNEGRDTSNDIDVFGMDLKSATIKTRIMQDKKNGAAVYWIPALAYRCLQYLNVYGPQELGIYRISGSTSVVDELKSEFIIRHDIDLFENPPDDLHTVSSLLKGWFRALPDAILPQDVQKRIYEKCKHQTESQKPPQAFIEELSNLPPYNYYLLNHLFSHLSAVCSASDVNKMNLSNLGMIFCSTLRIDRFCFNWLVGSWDECWAGCATEEAEYLKTLPQQRASTAPTSPASHSSPNPPISPTPPASPASLTSLAAIPHHQRMDSHDSRATTKTMEASDRDWPSPTYQQHSATLPERISSKAAVFDQNNRSCREQPFDTVTWEQHRRQMEHVEHVAVQEQEAEREMYSPLKRPNSLRSPTGHKSPAGSQLSPVTDDGFGRIGQATGSPATSYSTYCTTLPPIQPVSPLMK